MRTSPRLFVAFCAAGACLGLPALARADATGWTSTTGGVMAFQPADGDFTTTGVMDIDVGVGTSPTEPFVIGGVFGITPLFDYGADLNLSLRGATQSYMTGPVGLAIDLGAFARPWGEGTVGFAGGLLLGGPLGLTLNGQALVGEDGALGFGGLLGIDFVALLLYRETFTDFYPNPLPPQDGLGATGSVHHAPLPAGRGTLLEF